MSSKLFWAPPSFEWPTLLSTFLRNQLLWALFWVFFSFGQFLEPSLEQGENWGHSFEHSKECTYSQEPFFEWVYSRECSFGRFLEGSRSTRTLMTFCKISFLLIMNRMISINKEGLPGAIKSGMFDWRSTDGGYKTGPGNSHNSAKSTKRPNRFLLSAHQGDIWVRHK